MASLWPSGRSSVRPRALGVIVYTSRAQTNPLPRCLSNRDRNRPGSLSGWGRRWPAYPLDLKKLTPSEPPVIKFTFGSSLRLRALNYSHGKAALTPASQLPVYDSSLWQVEIKCAGRLWGVWWTTRNKIFLYCSFRLIWVSYGHELNCFQISQSVSKTVVAKNCETTDWY